MYINNILKKEYEEKYRVDESNIAEHLKEIAKMARNSASGAFKGGVGVEKPASKFIRRNVINKKSKATLIGCLRTSHFFYYYFLTTYYLCRYNYSYIKYFILRRLNMSTLSTFKNSVLNIKTGKKIEVSDKKFHFIAKNIECFKKLNFGFRESEMSDNIVKFQKLYDFYYIYITKMILKLKILSLSF